MAVAVEIAVQDATGVRIALAEGADRVELCSALAMGGLTPSAGHVAAAVEEAREEDRAGFVHVLVRPRGGGFVYDLDEVAVTVADIRSARSAGAAGVVVGALDEFSTVDGEAIRRFVDAAEGLPVTFHRAFDIVPDQTSALEELVALGVGRILTSGGAGRTIDGVTALRALAQRAAGRIEVMAGGGIGTDDIPAIAATGVDAVHLSARHSVLGPPSGPGGGDARYDITDAGTVAAAVAAVQLSR